MQLIDGKATAATIKSEIKQQVEQMVAAGRRRPHLAAILVGHDGGSETYVKNKVLACEACGFESTLLRFEDDITEAELLSHVQSLNENPAVDGFIVQLPLPKHIDEQRVIEAIDYRKDVDGFHPINVGRMAIGLPCFISATPKGILELLRRYNVPTSGRKCVILGRSNIVGKPMAQLMMQKQYGDATVTVCHSRSATLVDECRKADILIAAIGQPAFVKAEGLEAVRIFAQDRAYERRVALVFMIIRVNDRKRWAFPEGVVQRFAGFDPVVGGNLVFGQNDPVAQLGISADGERLILQLRVVYSFDRRIKFIAVNMKNGSLHTITAPRKNICSICLYYKTDSRKPW